MLTQRVFSESKSNNDIFNNSEEEQIKRLLREINNENKNTIIFDYKSPVKMRSLHRNRNTLSSTSMGTTFKKSYKSKKNENSLSHKLKDKITKERLILELRQELKYHIKCNRIYKKLLEKIIRLKETVKENRDKIKKNTDLLKHTFKEQYDMIINYEKTIVNLAEEKQDIFRINEEILNLREKNNSKLLKEYSDIEEKNCKEKEKIDSLKYKILDLEYKKSNLSEELQKQFEIEQKNYEEKLKKYKILLNNYKYYLDEYNSFLKTGEEMTKIDVKLFDDTYAKELLEEEDLKVKLSEKLSKKSFLLSNINKLKSKIKIIKEKQKEQKWKKDQKLLACKIISIKTRITKNQHIKNRISHKRIRNSLSDNDILFSK